MKIEITNREPWISKIETAIATINAQRKAQDEIYERNWRKGFLGLFPRSVTSMPPQDFATNYPSCSNYSNYARLASILVALLSKDTGTVYLDDRELTMIEYFQS